MSRVVLPREALGAGRLLGVAGRREACVCRATTPSWTDVDGPQREHPRYAHQAAIALHTPDQAISGRTCNVSRGGLCATLSEQIAVGTDVALDIQLVFEDDRHSEPLRLPGRVVWCTSLGDRFQVGVQFLPLDSESTEYVTMFLRYLDDGAIDSTQTAAISVDDRFR